MLANCNPHNPRDTSFVLARLFELHAGLETERNTTQAQVVAVAATIVDAVMRAGGLTVDECLQMVQRLLQAIESEGADAAAAGAQPQMAPPGPYGAPPGYWMHPGAAAPYGYPMPMGPMGYPAHGQMPGSMPPGYGGYPMQHPMHNQAPPPALPMQPTAPPPSGTILKGGAAMQGRGQQYAQPASAPNYGPGAVPTSPNAAGAADNPSLQLVNHRKLGEILVTMAMISQEDLDRALRAQKANGKRLGEVLVSMGLLSKEMVESAVRLQKQRNAGGGGIDFNRPQFKQRG